MSDLALDGLRQCNNITSFVVSSRGALLDGWVGGGGAIGLTLSQGKLELDWDMVKQIQVGVLGAKEDGVSGALAFDWSKWIDEFLSRIFVLLVNLEPSITS